jgi:hypothetical protein
MIVIVILAAALLTGIVSVVALVRAGIAREERGRSLADRPASRTEDAGRRVVGWHGEPPRIRSRPTARPTAPSPGRATGR